MKIVLSLILVFSFVSAFSNSDDIINEINSKQNLWKAGWNRPKNSPRSAIRRLLGSYRLPDNVFESIPNIKHSDESVEIPETFDGRLYWSQCRSLSYVADQSNCGSCWAVSVASAISDRICIHSNGKLQPTISAKYILTCSMGKGCAGGHEIYAWSSWQSTGLVTGGPYGSNIGCQPYPMPPCEHDTEGTKPDCRTIKPLDRLTCLKKCDNSSIKFEDNLFFGDNTYRVEPNDTQIQVEILKNGPVSASFKVYSDFDYYKSGVYSQITGVYEGGHAVRLIGWGVENGTKYWLAVNSWNEDWGDKGYFKIRRGTNECGIESQVSAGTPKNTVE